MASCIGGNIYCEFILTFTDVLVLFILCVTKRVWGKELNDNMLHKFHGSPSYKWRRTLNIVSSAVEKNREEEHFRYYRHHQRSLSEHDSRGHEGYNEQSCKFSVSVMAVFFITDRMECLFSFIIIVMMTMMMIVIFHRPPLDTIPETPSASLLSSPVSILGIGIIKKD
jgi:hypothetical protein